MGCPGNGTGTNRKSSSCVQISAYSVVFTFKIMPFGNVLFYFYSLQLWVKYQVQRSLGSSWCKRMKTLNLKLKMAGDHCYLCQKNHGNSHNLKKEESCGEFMIIFSGEGEKQTNSLLCPIRNLDFKRVSHTYAIMFAWNIDWVNEYISKLCLTLSSCLFRPSSCSITEVKHCQAWIVLGWETTWEHRVL